MIPHTSTPRVIKKYANRRLYDTATSTYIVLADVKALVLNYEKFVVLDAKTDEDLTRSVLLQIILEEEVAGHSGAIFTAPVLEQIIRFYGHTMQSLIGVYLEKNMQTISDLQQQVNKDETMRNNFANPDIIQRFANVQMPLLQGMMNAYVEQSRGLFFNMQKQMQSMFQFPTPPSSPSDPPTNTNAGGSNPSPPPAGPHP